MLSFIKFFFGTDYEILFFSIQIAEADRFSISTFSCSRKGNEVGGDLEYKQACTILIFLKFYFF